MPIHVPPLRDRPDDIHALSLFFLDRYARKYHKGLVGFTPDVYGIFAKQPWHGNVRELSHTIERMAIYASAKKEFLDIPDLPMDFLIASAETERKSGLAGDKEEFEKRLILDALRNNDYNSSRAARALRLPVETLRYRIKKYGINKDRPDST
jgi:transcriptional regulator with PAS, ATPase and Fis domain